MGLPSLWAVGPVLCPRGALELAARRRSRRPGGQAWDKTLLLSLRLRDTLTLCPLTLDRAPEVCRARLGRRESLEEG